MRKPSYSSISTYWECPQRYKYKYIDKLECLYTPTHDDALLVGKAYHLGCECDIETMTAWYYAQFPIIADEHINELIKLEYWVNKWHERSREFDIKHKEYLIECDDFKGIIDVVIDNNDNTVTILDHKYCSANSIDGYVGSEQLHLYAYFYTLLTGIKVSKLQLRVSPKLYIKQKQDETLAQFRNRMQDELEQQHAQTITVEYEPRMLNIFAQKISKREIDVDFIKRVSDNCKYCEYYKICNGQEDYNMLPSSTRRDISKAVKRKIWIYGPAFSGKTTMLDASPNPLNLNTDGNVSFVTMPFIALKDVVTVTGRVTERKYAWEVFKDTIAELEKKQNDFKTIIVDLLEDTREMCRVFKYNELKIQHESDSGYGKGWDIIKTEYLSTMMRLFNLDYENIVVLSHEDVSKDITKKNGQNITRISPNIQDAIATKIAGMVDIVARVVVEDNGQRTLNFKSNEVIFGGGRLNNVKATTIPLDWNELMSVYDTALVTPISNTPVESTKKSRQSRVEAPKETEVDQAQIDAERMVVDDTTRTGSMCPECGLEQHLAGGIITCANGHDVIEIAQSVDVVPETKVETSNEQPRRRRRA